MAQHGQEFWRAHLEAWHRSNQTQRAYCASQGIGEKAFYHWRRKEKEAVASAKWLFAGSERAGKRAAAIQCLLGTAKLNGLDPHAWLKDTLEKLPAWPNSRIDELLPLKTALP